MNSPTVEAGSAKRLFHLDLLRVIACLCVIMIHVSTEFVIRDFGSFDFWIANVLDSIAHMGVPLFVMISGAVFLDENYDFSVKKLTRHIIRIMLFFVFWSVCYTLMYNLLIPLAKHESISVAALLKSAVTGHYHLWFCFMIVGLYLIVPLLRLWVKKENEKQVRYFVILALIFSMLLPSSIEYLSLLFPGFGFLNSIISDLDLRYVGGYTAYFILGWYLNNFEIRHKKAVVVLGAAGTLFSVIMTAVLSLSLNGAYQAYSNLSVHIALQSLMVFVLVSDRYKSRGLRSSRVSGFVSFVSKYSLGIYAVHVIFVDLIGKLLAGAGITSSLLCIPITFLSAFLISLLISFTMSRIPLLRKVV